MRSSAVAVHEVEREAVERFALREGGALVRDDEARRGALDALTQRQPLAHGRIARRRGAEVYGLERLEDLLEGRSRGPVAVIAPEDGAVRLGDEDARDRVRVFVDAMDGRRMLVRGGVWRHGLVVREGDRVRRGEALTDGTIDHHELLRVIGPAAFARHLVDELVELYHRQGHPMSESRVALVVRALLSRACVLDPGDTPYAAGEVLPRDALDDANARALATSARSARYEVVFTPLSRLARDHRAVAGAGPLGAPLPRRV